MRPALASLFMLALASLATASHAAIHVEPYTTVSYSLSGPDGLLSETVYDPASVVAASAAYPIKGDSNIAGAVSARVGYGMLKVEAATSVYGHFANSQAMINAAFHDRLTVNVQGMEGQTGWITLGQYSEWDSLIIAGGQIGLGAQTQAHVSMRFGDSWIQTVSNHNLRCAGVCLDTTGGYIQTDILGVRTISELDADVPFRVPVVFGQSTQIMLSFSANTWAGGHFGSAMSARLDGSNSVYWGGVESVVDSSGAALVFDLTSASGTDYRHSMAPLSPVPEPSAPVLLAAGALVLLLKRQRRQPAFSQGGEVGGAGQQ